MHFCDGRSINQNAILMEIFFFFSFFSFLFFPVFFVVVVFFSLGFILSLMAMSREFSRSLLAHEMLLVHREIATTVFFFKGGTNHKEFLGIFSRNKGE